MSPDPVTRPASGEVAASTEPASLPAGKVYFEVPIDATLPSELRQKLSLAAYAKIQELDPDAIRGDWQSMHVQNDPAKMSAFIRNQCLYALGPASKVQDCLVVQDDPPRTTYCYDDTVRVCYHPFILVNPDTGLPLEVHASAGGVEASAPIQLILAWMSDPIFPGPASLDRQKVARFEAHEAVTNADEAVTRWPDSFRDGRAAEPVNGGASGSLRKQGQRCWVDFAAGEILEFDTGDGLAGDYTVMMVVRGGSAGNAEAKCDPFHCGTEDAGMCVTIAAPAEGGDTGTIIARHWTVAGEVTLTAEVAAAPYHVVTFQVSQEDGACLFVDAERVPVAARWLPVPALGASGTGQLGCRTVDGEPRLSLGELLVFHEPIWEEERLAVARYLMNHYHA